MKPLIFTIGIAIILGMGIYLYAMPQKVSQPMLPTAPPVPVTAQFPVRPAATTSAVMPLATTHTVGTAAATPTVITVGTSTEVTITIQITDPSLIPNSVNLLQLGATGTQPTILGVMQNAGSGMYTLGHAFNQSAAGQIQLQVSAAFKGTLQRVLSNVLTVNVWQAFTDANTGIAFSFPPVAAIETISSIPQTSSTAASIALIATDPLNNYPISLVSFVVNQNTQHLSLQAWFEQNVDSNNLLLNAGDVHTQVLSNGVIMLTIDGPIPPQYAALIGGPIPDVYALSADGAYLITIDRPEDPSLADINLSPLAVRSLLPSVLSTLTTP